MANLTRLNRLQSTLLTSGLQISNNPLYQVINQLLEIVKDEIVNSSSSSGSSTIITNILSGQGIPGLDGLDGNDGMPGMSGAAGIQGLIGPQGPAGMGVPGLDGEDGLDIIVPGPQGNVGATGASGGSDWDTTVTVSADQTVTNSATLVNCTDLVIALLSGTAYLVEFLIIYSGNNNATDFKWQFVVPLGDNAQAVGLFTYTNTADSATTGTANGGTNVWPGSAQGAGTDSSNTKRVLFGRFMIFTNAASNVQFQFAQAAASPATNAKVIAGSLLRIKKVV